MQDYELVSHAEIKLKQILGDRFFSAKESPSETIENLSFEEAKLIANAIQTIELDQLKEDPTSLAQDLVNIIECARDITLIVGARISLYSHEGIEARAQDYFKQIGLNIEDSAVSKDFSDLKRIIKGNRGNYFDPAHKVSKFLKGDLLENYFDDCLKVFKSSRDRDFLELLSQRAA